jgi:hypothetical protein
MYIVRVVPKILVHMFYSGFIIHVSGADPGFQVRGEHLKKLRRAEGGAKIFGVFHVKNYDFTPTIIFFPILGGGGDNLVEIRIPKKFSVCSSS